MSTRPLEPLGLPEAGRRRSRAVTQLHRAPVFTIARNLTPPRPQARDLPLPPVSARALKGDCVVGMLCAAFRALENLCVVLGNLPREDPREYRRHRSWDLLKAHRIAARLRDGDAVLDVGCGSGHTLAQVAFFRSIEPLGVDLTLDRVTHRSVPVRTYDGETLPFADGSFDVSLLCYVAHHLTPRQAEALLREAIRVTRRRLVLLEDSLPTFGRLYRLRNLLHRVGSGLRYAEESESFRGARDQSMFLTHDQWRRFLAKLPAVTAVRLEPLSAISRYRHHTLIDVELGQEGRSPAGDSDSVARQGGEACLERVVGQLASCAAVDASCAMSPSFGFVKKSLRARMLVTT